MKPKKPVMTELSRRQFLKTASASIAGATYALTLGKPGWYAYAQAQATRPCLISIHVPSGWDTNWFHMAEPNDSFGPFDEKKVSGLPAALGGISGSSPDPYGRQVTMSADNSLVTEFIHARYTERTVRAALREHPFVGAGGRKHWLGLGIQNAMDTRLQNFIDQTCIWKGIASGGQHTIPNKNIIHGSESQYAISYSGLISQALAERHGKLPLHYVQLCASPTVFGSNWAMAKGDQIPINIADYGAFKALTNRVPGDFQVATLFESLNDSIKRLGGELEKNRLTLAKSQSVYTSFLSSFVGALNIAGLGAKMGGFLAVWRDYAEIARTRLAAMHDPGFISKVSPEVVLPYQTATYNFHLYAPHQPLPRRGELSVVPDSEAPAFFKAQLDTLSSAASLTTPFEATEASLVLPSMSDEGVGLRGLIASYAWRFAMADFLVTEGHSNIVDIVCPNVDGHAGNSADLRRMTIVYSLYSKLLERLVAKGYMDRTLVAMYSEFDRGQGLLTELSLTDRGTPHGGTESILLSGYGVKKKTVFGSRLFDANGRPTDNGAPVSINGEAPATIDYKYPFPTIMEIFKVKIPENQITDGVAVKDVLA